MDRDGISRRGLMSRSCQLGVRDVQSDRTDCCATVETWTV